MSVFLLKKYPFVLAFCLLLAACSTKPTEPQPSADFNPEIPEETMIKLMTDVHIAEGLIQMLRGNEKDSIANISYQRIYKHYNIDEKKLDDNLQQYLDDPVVADRVYKKIIENLGKLETKPDPKNKKMKRAIEGINAPK